MPNIKACAAVTLDLFKTGADSLLEQTKELQGRKEEAMEELVQEVPGLQDVHPVTQVAIETATLLKSDEGKKDRIRAIAVHLSLL